jgi:hypothetical protein
MPVTRVQIRATTVCFSGKKHFIPIALAHYGETVAEFLKFSISQLGKKDIKPAVSGWFPPGTPVSPPNTFGLGGQQAMYIVINQAYTKPSINNK